MRIEIRFVRMRIPCGRRRFDSIRIECAFDPDKCARVDTPNEELQNCYSWKLLCRYKMGTVKF